MKKWCLLALLACNGCLLSTNVTNSSHAKSIKRPGALSLIKLSSLAKIGAASAAAPADTAPADISLDTVIGSYNQYFILQNTGDEPIKNLVITTDNPHLVFKPSQIPVLAPQSKLNLVQILGLAVIHGKRLEGFGFDSLMKMGMNVSQGGIKGTTTDAKGDSLPLEYRFTLSLFAKVMDVQAYSGDSAIDLTKPASHVTPPLTSVIDPGSIPNYPVTADSVRIVNSGNVDIKLTVYTYKPDMTTSTSTQALPVGAATKLVVPVLLEMDANGVAADPGKIDMAPTGHAYMAFDKPAAPAPVPPAK